MTREQAKEMMPIIQAYADGKTIQYRVYEEDNEWKDIDRPSFNDFPSEYRIKPEPNYRPFKNKEECWNEMLKHQPFGWVRRKIILSICLICKVGDNNLIHVDSAYRDLKEVFQDFEFADGSPFGVKDTE